jgi:hypothetical protein
MICAIIHYAPVRYEGWLMRKIVPTNWTYRGRDVFVTPSAQLPPFLRPWRGRFNLALDEALEQIEPWEETGDVFRTHCVTNIDLTVACVGVRPHEPRTWAIHRDHRSKRPSLVPFVKRAVWPTTRLLMVELIGTPSQPVVVRAYPNPGYVYPLPTMRGALTVEGGQEACIAFWRKNAYLNTSDKLLIGVPQAQPPEWWYW